MKRAGGFTIIEVLIALAITGVLLAAAVAVLTGQTTSTAFQQSLHDIQSKLSAAIQNVNNGLLPNETQYTCTVSSSSSRAQLSPGTGAYGTNQGCIYLGVAAQVIVDSPNINFYTILGNQYTTDSDGNKVATSNLAGAMPTPASTGGTDATIALTDKYVPTGGAKLTATRYTDNTGKVVDKADIAGFYNDPGGSDSTDPQLLSLVYTGFRSAGVTPTNGLTECIRGDSGCTSQSMGHWYLCYQDATGQTSAYIDVTANAAGISAVIKNQTCPSAS